MSLLLFKAMEKVTCIFDRIFDVQRMTRDQFGTTFGFEANGKRYFDVTVQGQPTLNNGMTVTALMRKKDDWSSLVGWVAHDSGEIVCRDSHKLFASAFWLLLLTVFAASFFPYSRKGFDASLPVWAKFGLCLIMLGFAVLQLLDGINSIRERQQLSEIALNIKGVISSDQIQ